MGVLDSIIAFAMNQKKKAVPTIQLPSTDLTCRRQVADTAQVKRGCTEHYTDGKSTKEPDASVMAGRAKLGTVVTPKSSAFCLLLAIEESIYQMLKHEDIISRPLGSQLIDQDYSHSQKVLTRFVRPAGFALEQDS
jgi:hypothetical protein